MRKIKRLALISNTSKTLLLLVIGIILVIGIRLLFEQGVINNVIALLITLVITIITVIIGRKIK
ncbi:MAG: hypothetical protein RR755_02965 [Erysipelotrichaceae bacterium]